MDLPVAARTLRRSAERAMVFRCSIQRDQADDADDWNQRGEPDWQPHLEDVPCYVRTTAGREPAEAATTPVLIDRRILVPLGTDVTEADRIASITDRDDGELFGTMGIEGVLRHHTHVEVLVEQIR